MIFISKNNQLFINNEDVVDNVTTSSLYSLNISQIIFKKSAEQLQLKIKKEKLSYKIYGKNVQKFANWLNYYTKF